MFISKDGAVTVDVRLGEETVWLSLGQIAQLLARDKSVISRHLSSVFREGELVRSAVVAKNATTAADGKTYKTDYYNLDAILSVGYRVNSKRGTQFRIWATGLLREHLVRGYTLNRPTLAKLGVQDLSHAVELLSASLGSTSITDEGRAVLDIITAYARSWNLLLRYDEERLEPFPQNSTKPKAKLTARSARATVSGLKAALLKTGDATDLFGLERDDRFGGIIAGLDQTFDGEALYPTAQSRAAHLLYFIIKNHPFADGNKRIGALMFMDYLNREGIAGTHRRLAISAETLVALALLVAQSDPKHKDTLIRLIINLIAPVQA